VLGEEVTRLAVAQLDLERLLETLPARYRTAV
jgi:hypothetical protein